MLNRYPEGDPQNRNCTPLPDEPLPDATTPFRPVRTFPFRYYLLRVAYEEVNILKMNQIGMKAFLSIAQNYAWVRKTRGGPFDVDNSTNFQCFRPRKSVDGRWRAWIEDTLDERVTKPNSNRLLLTEYRGNEPAACSDPLFPEHGGKANQHVIKALSEASFGCPQRTNWRDIVKYFYQVDTKIKDGVRPFLPKTGVVHFPDHSLRITFTSYFRGTDRGATVYENTAWSYRIVQRKPNGTFRRFRERKPSGFNAVPSSVDFTAAEAAGTNRYYVRACNPFGCSEAAEVRDPNTGIDITG